MSFSCLRPASQYDTVWQGGATQEEGVLCPALLELLSVVWQTSGTIRSFNVAFTLERSFALFA